MSPARRLVLARWLLGLLAAASLATGAYAAFAPHAFYRHVVGVDLLGPYNQHLMTDVGGFYLGFALLFGWAATTLHHELVRAACAAWILTQAIHVGYHAAHLDGFSAGQAIQELAGLGAFVVVPAAAALLMRRPAERG